jgi:hypothetical protein|tara:strand:- start:261 stop:749 length:489 start_codon:yes stop_codon:yes gene_type:complete
MLIRSQKDFSSGLMFLVVGLAFSVGATNYRVGESARMGPGYFPMLLGILLILIGVFVLVKSLMGRKREGEEVGKFAWVPLAYVLGANLLFGILLGGLPSISLPAMGLIPAIYVLTFVSSLAGDSFRLKEVTILATVLAVGSYVTFIELLNLQMQVWPTFITG